MKKILMLILMFIVMILLYSPGYFLGAWLLSFFCNIFPQVNSCNIISNPYNVSMFESIFIAIGVFVLWIIVLYIFYRDYKNTNNKLSKGKNIKSFKLI